MSDPEPKQSQRKTIMSDDEHLHTSVNKPNATCLTCGKPVSDPEPKQSQDEELRDICADVQLKLKLNDKDWSEIVGNRGGLYGLLAKAIDQYATIKALEARQDKLENLVKRELANDVILDRIAELDTLIKQASKPM